jgi:nucleotide-binding universal stress UspA family protein
MQEALMKEARAEVTATLLGSLPSDVVEGLLITAGRAGSVLARHADDAEMLIVGGKHHGALGRWIGGSTAHQLVRSSPVPVLIVGQSADPPRRVLVAVDLSAAAEPTIGAARRMAQLFGAELLVLHVVEPVPSVVRSVGGSFGELMLGLDNPVPLAVTMPEKWFRTARETFDRAIWPTVAYPGARPVVVQGMAEPEIRRHVTDWKPDVVVVGSHGKGLTDRIVLGSVTHHLVTDLPASLLVVPPQIAGAAAASRAVA